MNTSRWLTRAKKIQTPGSIRASVLNSDKLHRKGLIMALKITPTQKNTHTVSIALSGQLNSETASVLDQQIQKALVNGANVIVLDMADLKMITSAGVGVVMKTQTSMAKRGGEMIMLNMQPQIKKVFEIVRLLPTLQVFDDTQEMDNYLIKIQQRIQEDGSFDSNQ